MCVCVWVGGWVCVCVCVCVRALGARWIFKPIKFHGNIKVFLTHFSWLNMKLGKMWQLAKNDKSSIVSYHMKYSFYHNRWFSWEFIFVLWGNFLLYPLIPAISRKKIMNISDKMHCFREKITKIKKELSLSFPFFTWKIYKIFRVKNVKTLHFFLENQKYNFVLTSSYLSFEIVIRQVKCVRQTSMQLCHLSNSNSLDAWIDSRIAIFQLS